MTVHWIVLEAQQADALAASQLGRIRQLGLRAVSFHVRTEDHLHSFRMAGAHSVPSRLRRAQCLQVDIPDALLIQCRRELALGKSGLARLRHGPDVDQQPDLCLSQRAQHVRDGAALIADGEQLAHAGMIAALAAPEHGVFIAELSGEPVALLHVFERAALEKPSEAVVRALVVDRRCRASGIGGQMMALAERWAGERRLPSVSLTSRIDRHNSDALYAKLGYDRIATSHMLRKQLAGT